MIEQTGPSYHEVWTSFTSSDCPTSYALQEDDGDWFLYSFDDEEEVEDGEEGEELNA